MVDYEDPYRTRSGGEPVTDETPETTIGGEPMIHGTLETIEGRPALRFERSLTHPVDRVWRAVSVPAELGSWFPAAVE